MLKEMAKPSGETDTAQYPHRSSYLYLQNHNFPLKLATSNQNHK